MRTVARSVRPPAGKRKPVSEIKSALVSTFVDIPTKAVLDELSRKDDSSISRILRQAITEYIERRRAA